MISFEKIRWRRNAVERSDATRRPTTRPRRCRFNEVAAETLRPGRWSRQRHALHSGSKRAGNAGVTDAGLRRYGAFTMSNNLLSPNSFRRRAAMRRMWRRRLLYHDRARPSRSCRVNPRRRHRLRCSLFKSLARAGDPNSNAGPWRRAKFRSTPPKDACS